MNSVSVDTTREFRPGAGYLYFAGLLQIFAASLMILFSLTGVVSVALGGVSLFNPAVLAEMSDGLWSAVLAAFLAFQYSVGWVIGLAQLASGVCCLKRPRPRWVALASVVSLLNFPAGTLAAIFTLHGLTQREIADAFDP